MKTPPFHNTLQVGDAVLDTTSGKRGTVDRMPRGYRTAVVFEGRNTPVYMDVRVLRFIPPNANPPGTPEDVAPFDGEFPAEAVTVPVGHDIPPFITDSALDVLKGERDRQKAEMEEIQKRFLVLKAQTEKMDRAIAVLSER